MSRYSKLGSGVIGTAAFDADGSIANLAVAGIISSVNYSETGVFLIGFSEVQSDLNYTIAATVDPPTTPMICFTKDLQVDGFQLDVMKFEDGAFAFSDAPSIRITVFRLT